MIGMPIPTKDDKVWTQIKSFTLSESDFGADSSGYRLCEKNILDILDYFTSGNYDLRFEIYCNNSSNYYEHSLYAVYMLALSELSYSFNSGVAQQIQIPVSRPDLIKVINIDKQPGIFTLITTLATSWLSAWGSNQRFQINILAKKVK